MVPAVVAAPPCRRSGEAQARVHRHGNLAVNSLVHAEQVSVFSLGRLGATEPRPKVGDKYIGELVEDTSSRRGPRESHGQWPPEANSPRVPDGDFHRRAPEPGEPGEVGSDEGCGRNQRAWVRVATQGRTVRDLRPIGLGSSPASVQALTSSPALGISSRIDTPSFPAKCASVFTAGDTLPTSTAETIARVK